MDQHNPSGFQDEYASSDDQYVPAEQNYAMYSNVNVAGVPANTMPFQLQGRHPDFQDMGSISAEQVFRNNMNAMNLTQGQKSQDNFMPYHAPMGHSRQAASEPSGLGLSTHPGLNASALPKKPEESDSACRPRLTPEQTQFLEDIFSHTPRPTTQQKKRHALELGLTHEKVNNWFQNRRAKSKQMNRNRRELVLSPDDIHMQHWSDAPGVSSPLQYPEAGHQAMLPFNQYNDLSKGSSGMQTDMWGNPSTDISNGSLYGTGEFGTMEGGMGMMNGLSHGALQQSSQLAGLSSMPKGIHSLQTNWSMDGGIMTSPSESVPGSNNGMDMNEAMLSFPHSDNMLQSWHSNQGLLTFNGIQAPDVKVPPSEDLTSSPRSNCPIKSEPTSAVISQHVTPQRSPSPMSKAIVPDHVADFEHRRDSTTSELANHVNTFHLQKSAFQNNSDDEVFKTPNLPSTNLAARRKRERPAALVSMRTVSTPNTGEPSPLSNTTAIPPTAVRRIKSAGNSLNVLNGRIQKSGASSAQRSPLAQTFRDAATLERITTAHLAETLSNDANSNSQSNTTSPEETTTNMPWANSPSDSLGAPPLSASFTQNSYDELSWAMSPPITPVYKPTFYSHQQRSQTDIPQSAPAHITGFPNISPPPPGHHNMCASNYMAGQYQDTSFYAPVPMPPSIHAHSQILKAYEAEQQYPRIMRPGSGTAHYGLFSAASMPPQKEHKELEVVMANFPTPEARPRSLPRQGQGNAVFTFQNTGPKDYAASD